MWNTTGLERRQRVLALKTKHGLKKETLVLNFCIWKKCSGTDTNMLEERCKNSDGVKKDLLLCACDSDCKVEMPMFLCFDVILSLFFFVNGFNFAWVELFLVLNMFLVPIQSFQTQVFQCQYFLFQFRFSFQCQNSLSLFYSHRIFFNLNMRACFNDI